MVGLHAERVRSGAFRCESTHNIIHPRHPTPNQSHKVSLAQSRAHSTSVAFIPLVLDSWGVVWLGCVPGVGAWPSDASLSAKIYPGQPEHNQSLKVPSAEAKAGLCVTALFFSDCVVRPYSVDSVKGRTLLRETCSRRAVQDIVPTPQTVELPFAKARPSRDQ